MLCNFPYPIVQVYLFKYKRLFSILLKNIFLSYLIGKKNINMSNNLYHDLIDRIESGSNMNRIKFIPIQITQKKKSNWVRITSLARNIKKKL